ncbi:hypothetical protein ID866_7971 [Astraeus odoratus]|nr:hypothetical protein ID866_7971 [Astraeus odoratus]
MEAPSSVTLLKPRLRLLRRSPSPRMPDNGEDNTPRSGPSGFDHPANSADEDEQPTPRMPMKAIASGNGDPGPSHPTYSSPLTTATPADTPAARLRALLARAPRSPRSVPPVIAQVLPSDADSDLGSSRLGSSAASVARENLKDIFTRALREPGDTPQKGRPRRNSVDNSLMEISPVLEREKAKHRKKRCSLSDEEVDKRKFVIESDTSVRSSQAATFDTLRARLTSSQSQIMDQQLPTFLYDHLLEPDSGMQQAIGEIMSSENEASNAADPTTTPATSRPLASMTRGKHVTGIRSGNDSHELKLEGNGKDYRRSREDERNNQRERDWNRPKPLVLARTGTPDLPHRLSQELGHSHSDLSLSSPNPHNEFEEALKNGTSAIKAPASASKFGWHSHRPPLPPVGLNGSPDPRPRHNVTRDARDTSSPTPSSRSSSQMSGALKTSMIPVRSNTKSAPADSYLGHVAMPLHSTLSHSETHVESGGQEDMVLASDEESIMDFLPSHPTRTQINEVDDVDTVGHVNTGTERETLPSSGSSQYSPSSPSASPSNARYLNVSHLDIPSGIPRSAEILQVSTSALPESFTPPGTPPASYDTRTSSEAIQPFTLSTPPHQASSSSAIHYLRTPSPPHGLPDLPGPPSSSDDDTLELDGTPTELGSTVRTPRPPGAWASTPQQGNSVPLAISPSSESTPVLASTTPLPRVALDIRTRPETNGTKSGYLTPITRLRANSLPPHTPAPPGAWMATPNQPTIQTAIVDQSQFGTVGRKRNDLRVRFDVSESETSLADDHPSSPISAIKLSNPELPVSTPSAVVVEGEVKGVTPVQIPEVPSTSGITPTPAALDPPSTPNAQGGLLSPKSLRKSPMIRVVDAYGRERHDIESFETLGLHDDNSRADAVQQGRNRSQLILPSTSANANRSLVRIVDAMGREIEEQGEQQSYTSGADPSVVVNDTPLGRAETITRMKEILRDLQDSSDADRSSEETKLNSGYFEELEEASAAARLARDKLAENLEREAAKERQICLNQDALQPPTWINKLLLPTITRYAHIEARRLFYTTYYDPLYPELYVLDGSPCLSGVHSLSRPWTILDSWKTVRQEGWGVVGSKVWRALRHVGDQAWEQWGEHPHSHVERPT